MAILMVSHDLRTAVEEANKILHLQKQVLFYQACPRLYEQPGGGPFLPREGAGECKPTAGCHAVHLQTGPGASGAGIGRIRRQAYGPSGGERRLLPWK